MSSGKVYGYLLMYIYRTRLRSTSLLAFLVGVLFVINAVSCVEVGDEVEEKEKEEEYPKRLENGDELWLILYFLGCLYFFLGIAIVCDELFVPAITVMCSEDYLNLSDGKLLTQSTCINLSQF